MAYLLLHQEGHSLAQEAGQSVCEVVDQYIVAAQHGEQGVGWVAGAFALDHCGNVSLDIGFNFDTSQEVQGSLQVDHLANERQDQGDVSGDGKLKVKAFAIRSQFGFDIQDVGITDFQPQSLVLKGKDIRKGIVHQFFHFLDLLLGQ